MSTTLKSIREMTALLAALLISATSRSLAQSATYSYDVAGNMSGVALGATNSPTIATAPQFTLLESNSFATFSVGAVGAGLFYQWLSNGIPIIGANGDSLVIGGLPLNGTNLGNFSVVVSNSFGAVTSSPAALWSDANGNGIPDWWELKYFGNLNQSATGDYDRDGVANLNEYLEGTNPTNAASFNPRLYVQAARGSVLVSPSQPYYSLGQAVTLTATPDSGQGFVGWSGAVSGTKSTVSLLMNTNEYVMANFGFPLGVALNNTNLVWTTTGNELWFGQAEVTKDGVAAAQSGPIVSYWDGGSFVGDQTSLQSTFFLAQPQQLAFWWNVSSESPDAVSFSLNSNVVATLAGPLVSWQYFQTNLAAGVYTATWIYSKGPVDIPNAITYLDAAWVGNVSLTTIAPLAVTLGIQLAGANALLSWPTNGTSALQLQANTNLITAGGWQTVTNAPATVGTNYQVTVPLAGRAQFYRLH